MNYEPSLETTLSGGSAEGSRMFHCSRRATAWLRFRTAGAARLLPLLLLLTLPAAAQAQYTYTTNNSTITITGYSGSAGEVIIPARSMTYRSPPSRSGHSTTVPI